MDEVSHRVAALETRSPTSPSTPSSTPESTSKSTQKHFLKLDVPRFEGIDPQGWIFMISQFFDYHATPEEERITVASFYLDGAALSWYQWMYRNGQIHSWAQFLQALETRFAPTAYGDPSGKLFKLAHTTSVTAYLSEFENLANRIVGLSPPFLLSCFISGLKLEIKREVLAQQPHSLSQVAGLARLHEDKFLDLRNHRPWSPPPWQHHPITRTFTPPSRPVKEHPQPRSILPLLPAPPRPQFKHLSDTEMADRRDKGLCFNCDQKWSRNHQCQERFLLLVAEDDEDPSIAEVSHFLQSSEGHIPDPPQIIEASQSVQLSLNALPGVRAPETLRVTGFFH